MNIISKITSGVAIALLTISLALPGVVRADAWDWNYDYEYGSTGSDYSYDYGSTDYEYSYDYGSTDWNYDYDYGSTNWDTTYDYGSTDWNYDYDYGSTDWNYDYDYGSTDWNYDYDYGSTDWSYEEPSYDWSYEEPSYSYESPSYDWYYEAPTYSYDWTYEEPTYDWWYEEDPEPTTPTAPNPVCNLSLSDSSIDRGDAVTLSWGGANTNRVVITDSNGETIVSTTDVSSSREIYPRESTTFTMKATNAKGKVDTCTKSITVKTPSTPDTPNPVCKLTLSDSSIDEGDSVTITWKATDATRVVIKDEDGDTIVSTDDTSDSKTVYPRESTTLTMKAYNAEGEVDTCTKSLDVDEDEPTTRAKRPICELRVSDTVVRKGLPVLLTWDNTRAKEMTIRDQYGNVIISADNNTSRSANSGRQTVIPNQDVTYTMKVKNSAGTDTCSVSVDTTDNGAISVDRVPLAAVPYTGFDAGPTMMALFYVLLGIWAVAIAYYVMHRKYGVAVPFMAPAAPAPVASVAASVATAPVTAASGIANLPTDDNFEKMFGGVAEEPTFSLAQYAAQEHVFVTDEVIAAVQASAHTAFAQKAMFDALVAKARGAYPTEHGWLTIDSTRYAALNA